MHKLCYKVLYHLRGGLTNYLGSSALSTFLLNTSTPMGGVNVSYCNRTKVGLDEFESSVK